nr:MAG TPA: hypothetical protein [Bacteriophage sp.]
MSHGHIYIVFATYNILNITIKIRLYHYPFK